MLMKFQGEKMTRAFLFSLGYNFNEHTFYLIEMMLNIMFALSKEHYE